MAMRRAGPANSNAGGGPLLFGQLTSHIRGEAYGIIVDSRINELPTVVL